MFSSVRRHLRRLHSFLERYGVPQALQRWRTRFSYQEGDTAYALLTPEQKERIEELIEQSDFYSILDALAVIAVKVLRWFDPELAEFVDAVFLVIRIGKVMALSGIKS